MTKQRHWITGRVAAVSGASRGIGAAVTEAIAAAGTQVVLATRDGSALDDLAQLISASGGQALSVPTDVSKGQEVERLFAAAAQDGHPTALVCPAGIQTMVPFAETTCQIWAQTIGINLTGSFLCCRAAINAMRASAAGRIISVASSGAYPTERFLCMAAYVASKQGVVWLTEAIAVEGNEYDISAVCVCPGVVDTQMLRRSAPDLRPELKPCDVATLILALLDNPLTMANGAYIPPFFKSVSRILTVVQ